MLNNTVRAAGLDVLPIEPSDDSQQLLVEWENNEKWLSGRLIVTPHVAFYSPEALKEMSIKASIEVKRVLEGKPPRNLVNP
jgi:lactate dehydrogenase-like 2-hydroxyacid dehydrogenase